MTGKNLIEGPKLNVNIDYSLGEFFFKTSDRFKDNLCQIDATLDKKETYSTVREKSIRTALHLKKHGITNQDVVALCTKVTTETIIPIIAGFYIGARITNLDSSQSIKQLKHLLSLVAPKIVFVDMSSLPLIEESLKQANLTPKIVVFSHLNRYLNFEDFLQPLSNETDFTPVKVDISDTAVIFFSSGTTGLSKAICHSHSSFLNIAFTLYQSNVKCDTVLSFTSFYWISALMMLTTSFIEGGCRVILSSVDAEQIFTTIEKYKVTHMFMAPILTYKLTNFDEWHKYDSSSLHTLLVGGTPIGATQFLKLTTIFKNSNILSGYGLTEAGLVTIFNPENHKVLVKNKIGSSGKAASSAVIKVVDLITNKALGPNQKGEICVKSSSIMKGYMKTDSSVAFDDEGFLKTGDVGYYDNDECFYIIERLKEMFKYLSMHIVPSFIESVLLEHVAVAEAVVFGTPVSAEEGEAPTACIVLKKEYKTTESEIKEFVATKVADYEQLRGGVVFVKDLPKTPSGKFMRHEIRNMFLNK